MASTPSLQKKLAVVLRARVNPSIIPKFEGTSTGTRTITSSEIAYPGGRQLHGVAFIQRLIEPLFEEAVNRIENHKGNINTKKSSSEWFTHADPNNGAAYLLPRRTFSEQDTVYWFQNILGKSALAFGIILKAIKDKSSPRKQTRSASAVDVNLHPTEVHESFHIFLSSAPQNDADEGEDKKPVSTKKEDVPKTIKSDKDEYKTKPGASIPDIVLTANDKCACTIEMKTVKSMPNKTFRDIYEKTVDYEHVVIPFKWPEDDNLEDTEAKLLVQVYCQMSNRNVKYAVLSSYEATFFVTRVEKEVQKKKEKKNILVVAGPYFISDEKEFSYENAQLKVGHMYSWFALNSGIVESEELKLDINKLDTTCMKEAHKPKAAAGFQLEVVEQHIEKLGRQG